MNFFQLPIGAGRNDPVVGEVDGAQIRMAPDGTRYYEQYQEPAKQAIIEALTTTLDDQGRAIHDRTPQQPVAGKAIVDALLGGVTQGLTAPGRALRGEPVTYGDAWATALDYGVGSAPTSAPDGALRGGGIRAYHGSPHDFDKFRMDKIGTGEGAQAYGHGLYFAESEDVAREYRNRLSHLEGQQVTIGGRPVQDVYRSIEDRAATMPFPAANAEYEKLSALEAMMLHEPIETIVKTADDMGLSEQTVRWLQDEISPNYKPMGHMYEVNINANPDDFLDWDAPLYKQPAVAGRLGISADDIAAYEDVGRRYDDALLRALDGNKDAEAEASALLREMEALERSGLTKHGSDIAKGGSVFDRPQDATASAQMREAGIPGIKYKDGMSRGAEGGTRNFVVFDEDLISIVRKYGIAGAAAALGMTNEEVQQRMNGIEGGA